MSLNEYITAAQYAKKRGILVATVNAYCRNGIIQDCKKQGRTWMIHRGEI